MRWILAGLAFALLIGLAVFTVAMRTRNLAARARIALHNEQIRALSVERARRVHGQFGVYHTEELVRRVQALLPSSHASQHYE